MEAMEPVFSLIAGHVALDFSNTLDNRFDPARTVDLVPTYRDLVRFCEQAGVLSAAQARKVARKFGGGTAEGEAARMAAVELREAVERIFSAVANGAGRVAGADLAVLNGFLGEALAHRRIAAGGDGGFTWVWEGLDETADGLLWPIALAAGKLLVSGEVERVRECGNETCRWLFLDSSKNHSRVWCDMRLCGNRTKAKRYHARRVSQGDNGR